MNILMIRNLGFYPLNARFYFHPHMFICSRLPQLEEQESDMIIGTVHRCDYPGRRAVLSEKYPGHVHDADWAFGGGPDTTVITKHVKRSRALPV